MFFLKSLCLCRPWWVPSLTVYITETDTGAKSITYGDWIYTTYSECKETALKHVCCTHNFISSFLPQYVARSRQRGKNNGKTKETFIWLMVVSLQWCHSCKMTGFLLCHVCGEPMKKRKKGDEAIRAALRCSVWVYSHLYHLHFTTCLTFIPHRLWRQPTPTFYEQQREKNVNVLLCFSCFSNGNEGFLLRLLLPFKTDLLRGFCAMTKCCF